MGTLAEINKTAVVLFAVCFGILQKFKLNPVTVIVLSGIIGVGIYGKFI